MILRMAPPKASSPAASLPEALRPLAAELARLPLEDRERVISAARAANMRGTDTRRCPAVA
jgi:hypothetical protein